GSRAGRGGGRGGPRRAVLAGAAAARHGPAPCPLPQVAGGRLPGGPRTARDRGGGGRRGRAGPGGRGPVRAGRGGPPGARRPAPVTAVPPVRARESRTTPSVVVGLPTEGVRGFGAPKSEHVTTV